MLIFSPKHILEEYPGTIFENQYQRQYTEEGNRAYVFLNLPLEVCLRFMRKAETKLPGEEYGVYDAQNGKFIRMRLGGITLRDIHAVNEALRLKKRGELGNN